MRECKKTNLKEFKARWTLCVNCAACYYHGPIIPHNWFELPPPEWSAPLKKCPSYEYFKFRAYTAVGRGTLATLVFDNNQFPITDDLIKIVYTCTSCGMCSEICAAYKPLTAIWALREELVQRGVSLPKPLENIEATIKQYKNIFGARKAPTTLKGLPTKGEDIYFAGCVARFREPRIAKATVEVLKAAGLDIAHLGDAEKCCGFIPGHDGDTQLLEEIAAQNVEALDKAGAKRVIVSCSHCYKALRTDYQLIFGDLPFEVIHIAELFAKLIDEKRIDFRQEINKRITYHDPCFLGRQFKVYDEPRKVLVSIPGIELAEMERNKRWSYCCGSGAKITSLCYPEFTAATTKERLMEGQIAADTIVTACTTCFSHMDRYVQKEGLGLEIIDFPIMVAKAMGIKF